MQEEKSFEKNKNKRWQENKQKSRRQQIRISGKIEAFKETIKRAKENF